MKILYVYAKLPGVYQPYMTHLLYLIKNLMDVKSFSYGNEKEADISYKSYGFKDLLQRALFKMRLSKSKSADVVIFNKYDIIHLQHSYLFKKIIPFKKIKNKSKVIITLRGEDTYIKPWLYLKWKNFYTMQHSSVDAFIAVSNHQKEYLINKWSVSADKIHVIPVSFGEKCAETPRQMSNDGIIKLISVFRMTWEKNINECVLLAKKMKENNINFIYDFYGAGRDLGQLYYLVDKYDLSSQINIKGVVPNSIINKRYGDYDFCIQLSLSESLGTTILEAQSKGVPCFVSGSDGLPETIEHGKTGFVNHENSLDIIIDRITMLMSDSLMYNQFSENSINFANSNYSVEIEISKLKKLYFHLMNENFII
jgi:glycosyltransferase involved in cell wall biosynthesis